MVVEDATRIVGEHVEASAVGAHPRVARVRLRAADLRSDLEPDGVQCRERMVVARRTSRTGFDGGRHPATIARRGQPVVRLIRFGGCPNGSSRDGSRSLRSFTQAVVVDRRSRRPPPRMRFPPPALPRSHRSSARSCPRTARARTNASNCGTAAPGPRAPVRVRISTTPPRANLRRNAHAA